MTPGARVPLTSAQRQDLARYLDREFNDALPLHQLREQRLQAWDDLYRAKPKSARKNWPWDGAANLVIPMIGTTVDSIEARIVNTIFGVDPLWTVKPLHKDFTNLAKPTEDFLEWSRHTEFNAYKPIKRWCNEIIKYGWSWLKPVWDIQTKPYFRPSLSGKPVREELMLRRPVLHHVFASDVVCQAGIEDETQAEWIAHRFRLTDGALRWRKFDETYDGDVERVIGAKEDATTHHELMGGSDDGPRTAEKLNTLYEIQLDYPLDAKIKLPVSLVVTFHRETKEILRCIYNPSYYGERALVKGTFVEYEGRFEGIGICDMLADLQDEMSTVHNQQVDNATLANTRFFLARRGQVKPNTRIWPGRVLSVGDPERDLKIMQLGDIYPSMRSLEQSILAFAERRSGVTDYQLGRESTTLGSRATATGTLALIQEGNRRFDLNVRDMRDSLSEVGKRLLLLNQQFRPRGLAYFVQGEDGALTEQTLDLPEEYLAQRLGVQLTASTATINREVEKQGLLALVQLLQQNLQVGQQAAMVVGNPQVPAAVREYTAKAFEGISSLMQRVVHAFDQKDVDALIPVGMLEAMENAGVTPGDAGAAQLGGLGGAAPGADGQPGVGGVPGLAA